MRVAIISDIHANLVALESVLDDLQGRGVDRVVCLGDVATDGPEPRGVIGRLRDLDISVVRGNMDDWLLSPAPRRGGSQRAQRLAEIQRWGLAQLTPNDLDCVRTFAATHEVPLATDATLLCYHGSPRSNQEGITSTTADPDLEAMLAGRRADVYAGGHTHAQMLRRAGAAAVLNPGSVGAPQLPPGEDRRRAWAEYAVLTWSAADVSVELHRVAVDLQRLGATILRSGMPHAMWWLTLRYGGPL